MCYGCSRQRFGAGFRPADYLGTCLVSQKIVLYPSPEDVWKAAAESIAQKVETTGKGKVFTMALSGGSTPRGMFGVLAAEPYRSRLPWSNLRVFWGDERSVPPEHPDSNFRMAREALLDHVPIPPDQVFRMEGECEPEVAAARYEKVLQAQFHLPDGVIPRFDLLLLGMGSDGHTASLFPGTPALSETHRLVVANWVESLQTFRITLTPPVLNAAREVVFLVCGEDKADVLQGVLEGERQPQHYPAQLVNPTDGNVIWFLDRAAGSRLCSALLTQGIQPKGVET
jgi:6-phosphogluconolactonase